MFSLLRVTGHAARKNICNQCLRTFSTSQHPPLTCNSSLTQSSRSPALNSRICPPHKTPQFRGYSSKTSADAIVEELQEQYAMAKDEFEIASDGTENKSIYAEDDRAAAIEELEKLKAMYAAALEGPDREEVKRRVGQRVRELEGAVVEMVRVGNEE